MVRRHICSAALGAFLLVSGSLSAWPVALVGAQSRSLVAASSAQGMRVTYTVPDLFVVTEFVDGGGPVAQATVDSTGRAVSFASLPYPGENAVTAPGLASFATGLPVPDYPFYARADHPVQPSQEVKDPSGSYALVASAGEGNAAGSADFAFGGMDAPVSGSSADASGLIDADGVTVEAVSVSKAIDLGEGALSIGSVTSRSVTTYVAGGAEPETATELRIEGARVGGQPVTIGPDGVHPGEETVPLPVGSGSESLNQVLAQAGITVKTIEASEIEGGAAGEVLEITLAHPIPGAENVQGTLVYQLGGSSSSIAFGEGVPGLPVADVPSVSDVGPPQPAAAEPAPPAPVAEAPAPAPDLPPGVAGESFPVIHRDGALTLASGPVTGAETATTSEAPAPSGAVAASGAAPAAGTAQPVVLARDFSGTTKALFALLAVAGALAVSSSALWRFRAVLAQWKS